MEKDHIAEESQNKASLELQSRTELEKIHTICKYLLETKGSMGFRMNEKTKRLKMIGKKPKKLIFDSDNPNQTILKDAFIALELNSPGDRPQIIISTTPGQLGNENYDLLDIDIGYTDEFGQLVKEGEISFTSTIITTETVKIKINKYDGTFKGYQYSSSNSEDDIRPFFSVFKLVNTYLNNPEAISYRRAHSHEK